MSTIYETVTKTITDALERGVVPWKKPWRGSDALPANAVSKRPYRGVNTFLLSLSRFADHRWLTFRQAQELGGHVRNGERSSLVVFWKQWDVSSSDEEATERNRKIPLLRHYAVFNVEQCEDLQLPPLDVLSPRPDRERIAEAEAVVQGLLDPPSIAEGGNSAFYRPSDDHIQMPPLAAFTSANAFYATLFHELGHATGHEKRLNRPGVTATIQFGSADYSREELVAELTSAFCCARIGLDNSLTENAASYLDGWLGALHRDPKALVLAAGQAQRAVDYIQGAVSNE